MMDGGRKSVMVLGLLENGGAAGGELHSLTCLTKEEFGSKARIMISMSCAAMKL
jgi:hypothetical protein